MVRDSLRYFDSIYWQEIKAKVIKRMGGNKRAGEILNAHSFIIVTKHSIVNKTFDSRKAIEWVNVRSIKYLSHKHSIAITKYIVYLISKKYLRTSNL